MSEIEDWAREQAEKKHAELSRADLDNGELVEHWEREAFAGGVVRAFDALLSDDKAARAAVRQLTEFGCNTPAKFRAALQAAVRAVTDPKTHDSERNAT